MTTTAISVTCPESSVLLLIIYYWHLEFVRRYLFCPQEVVIRFLVAEEHTGCTSTKVMF